MNARDALARELNRAGVPVRYMDSTVAQFGRETTAARCFRTKLDPRNLAASIKERVGNRTVALYTVDPGQLVRYGTIPDDIRF